MIRLFHGSNITIHQIDLSKCRIGKDFGQGFYLSKNYEQAANMAQIVTAREGTGNPVVTEFEFDNHLIFDNSALKTKVFDGYTEEWARFILLNRSNYTETQAHDYDIVYGPIADDKIGIQIRRFQLNYISIDALVHQLSFAKPTFQYFFGTSNAISHLHRIGDYEL